MTPRYPGAVWIPSGSDQGANNGPVAFSWHEAVTTGSKEAIAGWVSSENSCHAFVGQHGDMAQYKDFDRAAYGVYQGNYRGVVTIETWDDLLPATGMSPNGSHGPNDFPWDDGQCERIADVIAWANIAFGIPIHFMANTREGGHAPHRLGVPSPTGNVNVGYGPDQWTTHPGKECPGDKRILQLRGPILARAQVLANGMKAGKFSTLPAGPVNLQSALARGGSTPPPPPAKTPAQIEEEELMSAAADILAKLAALDAKIESVKRSLDTYSKVNGQPYPNPEMVAFQDFNINVVNDGVKAIAAQLNVVIPPRKAFARIAPVVAKPPVVVAKPPVVVAQPTTTKINPGEGFDAIARRLRVTSDQLAAANPQVKNRDSINAGDTLNIPKV